MRLLIFIAMVLMTFTPATAESHDAILWHSQYLQYR